MFQAAGAAGSPQYSSPGQPWATGVAPQQALSYPQSPPLPSQLQQPRQFPAGATFSAPAPHVFPGVATISGAQHGSFSQPWATAMPPEHAHAYPQPPCSLHSSAYSGGAPPHHVSPAVYNQPLGGTGHIFAQPSPSQQCVGQPQAPPPSPTCAVFGPPAPQMFPAAGVAGSPQSSSSSQPWATTAGPQQANAYPPPQGSSHSSVNSGQGAPYQHVALSVFSQPFWGASHNSSPAPSSQQGAEQLQPPPQVPAASVSGPSSAPLVFLAAELVTKTAQPSSAPVQPSVCAEVETCISTQCQLPPQQSTVPEPPGASSLLGAVQQVSATQAGASAVNVSGSDQSSSSIQWGSYTLQVQGPVGSHVPPSLLSELQALLEASLPIGASEASPFAPAAQHSSEGPALTPAVQQQHDVSAAAGLLVNPSGASPFTPASHRSSGNPNPTLALQQLSAILEAARTDPDESLALSAGGLMVEELKVGCATSSLTNPFMIGSFASLSPGSVPRSTSLASIPEWCGSRKGAADPSSSHPD